MLVRRAVAGCAASICAAGVCSSYGLKWTASHTLMAGARPSRTELASLARPGPSWPRPPLGMKLDGSATIVRD
ncbi:hypothetical protein [Kribbella sp. DT2]|uniref:hypothetical protein n=1 Tax=Kribbella sp. DT2 TaxID=3393427 RepID=UPI003CF562FC